LSQEGFVFGGRIAQSNGHVFAISSLPND